MAFPQTDIDSFRLDFFFLSYNSSELMEINFMKRFFIGMHSALPTNLQLVR